MAMCFRIHQFISNSMGEVLVSIRRETVLRYRKSGKLALVFTHPGHDSYVVLNLSSDMQTITGTRTVKFINRNIILGTKYEVEFAEKKEGYDGKQTVFSYRLVRVLTSEDTDQERWTSTASLEDLPVSPEMEFTREERIWAGEREGNLGGGIALAVVTVGGAGFAIMGYMNGSGYIFPGLVGGTAGYFLITYKWRLPKKPRPEKLEELSAFKTRLRERAHDKYLAAKTKFEKALEDYDYWESLSPQKFELAVSLRLEKEGYKVEITQYVRDGGVDIHAVDDEGAPMIVQAKQYSSNVGVAVVREIIGVRESSPAKPKALIFSLVGFTRGARELAEKESVELRDIKCELLGI